MSTAAGRFERLDDALRSPGVRVLSLDVFDTLLWRKVPKPTDAHLLLGRHLVDEGLLKPHVGPRLFARLRVLAEQEARDRELALHGSAEVKLRDICAILAPAITDKLGPRQLAKRELDHERSITFPDTRLMGHIEKCLSNEISLIAVSDTYLSAADILSLLEPHSTHRLPFTKIYTSSDCGTGKGAGLWQHVITELDVPPASIVHAGDNFEADVAAAGRFGVTGIHLPLSTDRFAEVVHREHIVGDDGEPSSWCDERGGDGGITAARRRATFIAPSPPVHELSEQERVTWETGTSVLGPVFAGYAQWVHQRAADLGADRALCVMREGRFLKRLLDGAQPVPGRNLTTRTIWASREACARASVYKGSEAELRSFLSRLRTPSARQLLDSLGLLPKDWPELRSFVDELQEPAAPDAAVGNRLIELVLSRQHLVEAVVQRSKSRRHRLVQHLRAVAGSGDGPVLVVDVGWGGTILESLQRMLDTDDDGEGPTLHGLFLLAHIGSAGPLLRGVPLEGYLGDSGYIPFDIAGVTGNPELVELACMCEEGTFLEMDAGGEPVLATGTLPAGQPERRQLLQDGIAAYLAEWVDLRPSGDSHETSPEGRTMLRRVLERFLSQPTRDEVEAFRWWGHEENFGSTATDQLVPDRLLPTLRFRTAESLHHSPPSELYWVGAAATLVNPETADAVLLMRRGQVGPGRFSSAAGIGSATIWLLDAAGGQRHVADVPILVNRGGLSLVEWKGELGNAVGVEVRPSPAPAVLRLDHVGVVTADFPDRTSDKDASTRQPGQVDGIDVDNALVLGEHTFAVDGRTRLRIAVPAHLRSSAVIVTVAGAYLPVPPGTAHGRSLAELSDELSALRNELAAVYNTKVFRATAGARRVYAKLRRLWRTPTSAG